MHVTTAGQKKQQRELWGKASVAWDLHHDWLETQFGGISQWLCDAAAIAPAMRVLDLACGTGEPAVTAAGRVGPNGRVTATDLSPEMKAATSRRVKRLGLDVDVLVMDAERLEFADAAFDAVTCRFGLMFCANPVGAAAEIYRVLKPGGHFAVAVWDEPALNPFLSSLMELVNRFVPPQAPEANAPGAFRLSPPGELARVLNAGGFNEFKVEQQAFTMHYASPDEYWEIQSSIAAPVLAAISTLAEPETEQLRAAVLDFAAAHVVDGQVCLGATALTATGMR